MNDINLILSLADSMPGGRHDSRAAEKLTAEFSELRAAIAASRNGVPDELDDSPIWAEVADVVYYSAKSIALAAALSGLSIEQAIEACIAKYELRARPGNPKDPPRESAAVAAAVTAVGFGLRRSSASCTHLSKSVSEENI